MYGRQRFRSLLNWSFVIQWLLRHCRKSLTIDFKLCHLKCLRYKQDKKLGQKSKYIIIKTITAIIIYIDCRLMPSEQFLPTVS